MISIRNFVLAGVLAATFGVAQAAYVEIGDASNLLTSAQTANDNTIQGMIAAGDEGDVYRVTFASGGTLTIAADSTIDAQIGLFDASFHGLIGDDDSGPGLNPLMSFAVTAGTYYVAIGDFPMIAVDGEGDIWFLSGSPYFNIGTIGRVENNGSISSGSYTLTLSLPVATGNVPEPASLALMGLALTGLGLARRRRA